MQASPCAARSHVQTDAVTFTEPEIYPFLGAMVSSFFTSLTPAMAFAFDSIDDFSSSVRTGPRNVTVPFVVMIFTLCA
jgi:hypothetical protein